MQLPTVPQKLSGVHLGPLLGKGSYASVYRGRQQGRQVAVKVLDLPPSDEHDHSSDSGAEQIIAEAVLSKQLSHPNIVETLDYVMVDCGHEHEADAPCQPGCGHQMWIVQKLCNKGSMYDGIKSGLIQESLSPDAPPSMPLLYQTALEIATAMQYLHAEGVLHGDLSGNNVLLTSADNERGWKAVVCDFGLATWAASSENGPGNVRPLGTASHMPPEMLNGGWMTKAADVYSFGVLLWELFCGERAWAGCLPVQIVFAVGTLGHTLDLPEEAPAALKDLAAACMAPDPLDRPHFDDIVEILTTMLSR